MLVMVMWVRTVNCIGPGESDLSKYKKLPALFINSTSNSRDDAAKLKWDGVRCLFEDAQSDILLLLDTCSLPDLSIAGSNGTKQAIAANPPDKSVRDPSEPTFTTYLIDTLRKLSKGRTFSTQRLYDELCASKQHHSTPPRMANGASHTRSTPGMPVFSTLTPGKSQHLMMGPLNSRPSPIQNSEAANVSPTSAISHHDDQLIDPESVSDLLFEETKILVCTTFVGDASVEMTHFNQWLQETPDNGAKISVEGMFIGPPTMLLISMSQSVWNVVQHDKVCCFLGYINSHNMLHLYQKLAEPMNVKSSTRAVEEGRMLLEARERGAVTPGRRRRDTNGHKHYDGLANSSPTGPRLLGSKPKCEMEDSVEMQEAAEQLKALSHVRHLSDEAAGVAGLERQRTTLPNGLPEARHDIDTDHPTSQVTKGSPTSGRGKAARRSLPKQETRCTHCSHAPFKDSSSLRKHVAAAHTRPFPCAFSFAGCQSTFGSKNEWKRHIASQHLCLTYYRCSSCPSSGPDGKGNEFNRKDLFTQHLRRMHAPFQIKRAVVKTDARVQQDWDDYVREMQRSCIVQRREPPRKAACPKDACQVVFEGLSAWDEWTEHVGRHMEKSGGARLGIDPLLAKWALDEDIIEGSGNGEYRLVGSSGSGSNSIFHGNTAPSVAPALTDGSSAESTNSVSGSASNGPLSSPIQAEPGSILGKRTMDDREEHIDTSGEPMSYEEIKKIVDPIVEANAKKATDASPMIPGVASAVEPSKEMEVDSEARAEKAG